MPAYEDGLHALFRAQSVLPDLDPAELSDPARRRDLADRLSLSVAEPTGYVLPVRRDDSSERWVTGVWQFRRARLYLIPGDSALGYRLPLDGLIEDEESRLESQLERDPFDQRGPLPPRAALVGSRLMRVPWRAQRVIGGCTYYPALRAFWSPGASAAPAPLHPEPHGPTRRYAPLPPVTLCGPSGKSGRFVPRGSGEAVIGSKHKREETPFLLDLTQPA